MKSALITDVSGQDGAYLFVFPSLYEGFGFPPLEAMACGCPIAVSNVASLPEVCRDAALYFDPLDMEDIAAKILKVIQNDDMKKTLIRKGFDQVKKYSWRKSVSKFQDIINRKLK